MKEEIPSPRFIVERKGIKLLFGGRPYFLNGKQKQSAISLHGLTIDEALKKLAAHEEKFL